MDFHFGLFQQQAGNIAQAEQLYKKGLDFDPLNTDINYALAFMYIQMKQPQKAIAPATVLKRVDPANPNYEALFKELRLN